MQKRTEAVEREIELACRLAALRELAARVRRLEWGDDVMAWEVAISRFIAEYDSLPVEYRPAIRLLFPEG